MNCGFNYTTPKRYIQFNDLVFLGRKAVYEQSESTSLRESKTSRTFANGSYVANSSKMLLIDSNTITVKIALRTNEWSEENVRAHYDFIIQQLMTPGKLWAIQSGLQLVWCNAQVTSFQQASEWTVTDEGYLVFSVEFDNPDGVWYKANDLNVYLEPYENCDFIDMKAECLGKNRFCCNEPLDCGRYCECCENKCADMCDMIDLCSMQSDLKFINDFYEECNSSWRVVYNCMKVRKDGRSLADSYPHTICDVCVQDVISGSFQSTTVLDSHKWKIAIMGNFVDPTISINSVDLSLKGSYKGVITIDYTGEVRYASSWECLEFNYETVPLDSLDFCNSMPTIVKGRNDVALSGIVGESACIYIDYESVTM